MCAVGQREWSPLGNEKKKLPTLYLPLDISAMFLNVAVILHIKTTHKEMFLEAYSKPAQYNLPKAKQIVPCQHVSSISPNPLLTLPNPTRTLF